MAEGTSPVPQELWIEANGLEHRVLRWGTSGPAVFLVHGFADAAATWDAVAPVLANHARVFAPDLRGFGRGARAPRGSYYHFPDYVADLAGLVDALAPDAPIILVGHSMGGVVATLYAAAFPERVVRFANLEGLGPPDQGVTAGATRMRTWIDGVRALKKDATARGPMSLVDARRRLGMSHPRIAPDVLDRKLPYLLESVEGGVRWLFDPLHRTTAPVPFFTELFAAYASRVTCPVLFVSGGMDGFHPTDEEARLAGFPSLTRVVIEDAGHMLHWTKPVELTRALEQFFAQPPSPPSRPSASSEPSFSS